MKLNIPEIGSVIKLSTDWTFKLIDEYRNTGLWSALIGVDCSYSYDTTLDEVKNKCEPHGLTVTPIKSSYYWTRFEVSKNITLPAGTVLSIDRIYIRSRSEYNSLAFRIKETTLNVKKNVRFWANLSDVNTMEIVDAPTLPVTVTNVNKPRTAYIVRYALTLDEMRSLGYFKELFHSYKLYPQPGSYNAPFIQYNYHKTVRSEDKFIAEMLKKYPRLVAISPAQHFGASQQHIYKNAKLFESARKEAESLYNE